jgi:hypothetical protein
MGPSNEAFTDQWSKDLAVEGGHRRCPLSKDLLISGSKPHPSWIGTADALDLRDY